MRRERRLHIQKNRDDRSRREMASHIVLGGTRLETNRVEKRRTNETDGRERWERKMGEKDAKRWQK